MSKMEWSRVEWSVERLGKGMFFWLYRERWGDLSVTVPARKT